MSTFDWAMSAVALIGYGIALVLALSFDVYARTWKAAERRAEGWQVVGKFGNSVVHARMPADQIEDLRKRIQVIDANGNREV